MYLELFILRVTPLVPHLIEIAPLVHLVVVHLLVSSSSSSQNPEICIRYRYNKQGEDAYINENNNFAIDFYSKKHGGQTKTERFDLGNINMSQSELQTAIETKKTQFAQAIQEEAKQCKAHGSAKGIAVFDDSI